MRIARCGFCGAGSTTVFTAARHATVWLAALLTVLLVMAPSPVWAHAKLTHSDPADGAALADAPREMRLWFSENISPVFSSAQLFDINGRPVAIAGRRIDPADPNLMILELPEQLPAGVYSVLAKLLSEADGHFSRSFLVFGIGTDVNPGALGAAEEAETMPSLLEVLLRWFNFGLLAALIGVAAVVPLVLFPTGRSRAGPHAVSVALGCAYPRLTGWAVGCSALSAVVGVGLLQWQSFTLLATLPEGTSLATVCLQVLTRTRWGVLWLAREVNLLALGGALFVLYRMATDPARTHAWFDRFPSRLWLAVGLLCVTLTVLHALTGHAVAVTPDTALAVVADIVHLLAAGLWVGGIFALAIAWWPLMRRRQMNFGILREAWGPFSRYAALSVGLLFATGLYQMGRQVASLDALITTLYGQALLIKIALVVAVGVFGLLNSLLLHPRLIVALVRTFHRPLAWPPLALRRLPILILCEASLALIVLLATGLITATPTPHGPEFRALPEHVPSAMTQSVDDMVITLSAKPNRPGQNVFTVFAASTRRPADVPITRVMLRFTYLDQDLGRASVNAEEVERGRYLIGGNYLSLVGAWQIDVVVRRRGMEDSVARFHWIVAPPGGVRPAIISKTPLEAPLTAAGAVIILTLLAALVMAWWGQRPRSRQPVRPEASTAKPVDVMDGRTISVGRSAGYLLLLAFVVVLSACERNTGQRGEPPNVSLKMQVDPSPPRAGPSHLSVFLRDASGAPVGADGVDIEGEMNHPGMQPLRAKARRTEDGTYEAPFVWTMAGAWQLTVTATLADGGTIMRQFSYDVVGMGKKDGAPQQSHVARRVPNNGSSVRIASPRSGATFETGQDISVQITTQNFELGADGKHWHVYIDGGSSQMIMGKISDATLRDLVPGSHEISAYLSRGTHEELETGDSVTVTIVEPVTHKARAWAAVRQIPER